MWNGEFTRPRLVVFFCYPQPTTMPMSNNNAYVRHVGFLILEKRVPWRSSSKFHPETHTFVRMLLAVLPRSWKLCRWRLHRQESQMSSMMRIYIWIDVETTSRVMNWCVTFWAFTMELLLLGRIFIFQSLQEASLQTLGVDMCEDMTELEFLHNELAWTLNASFEPHFF